MHMEDLLRNDTYILWTRIMSHGQILAAKRIWVFLLSNFVEKQQKQCIEKRLSDQFIPAAQGKKLYRDKDLIAVEVGASK